MEERAISKNINAFNCTSIYKKTVSKKMLIIVIAIIFAFSNKKVSAQVEVDNIQDQKINKIVNQNIEEALNIFTVNNNTYKILEEGVVILWSYNGPNDKEDVVVKDKINYNGDTFQVRYIYEKAFSKSNNIKSIKIENNILGFCDSYGNFIKDLNGFLKYNKMLRSVDLGNIDSFLGEECFFDCSGLINIKMPKNTKSIGRGCFQRCNSLETIDLSEIKQINGQRSFEFCENLRSIGELNDALIKLPERTFKNCTKLEISNLKNVRKLEAECFKFCRLLDENIVINVEEIGENCFYGCNFDEVYLKEAKKVYENAFGGMESLKKVRFGNSTIPFLSEDITMGSGIEEWIYPKDYITKSEYFRFLSKLRISKVKFYPNYNNLNYEVIQYMKLNSLISPPIKRPGYEIEGWYKEPECINKVNMIVDLGEVIGSDFVIKNPKLYAKWRLKEETSSKESQKTIEGEAPKLSDLNNSEEGKEDDKEKEEKKTNEEKSQSENENNKCQESTKNKELVKTNYGHNQELEKGEIKFTEPQRLSSEEIITANESKEHGLKNKKLKERNIHKSNKRIKLNKSSDFSKKLISRKNVENHINDFYIKVNNEDKVVELKKSNEATLDYKMTQAFVTPLFRNNIELEVFNISYKDVVNGGMQINKTGILGLIVVDDECIGIYLKGNEDFEKDSVIEIKFNDNTNLEKLYLYNEKIGKFMLINDSLEVKDNFVRIETTNSREYLITNF